MRAAKVLAIVGITALTVGVFTAVALAGKKKKTSVVFFNGSPKINKSGKVTAKGSINTASACEPGRSMRLQVLDSNGVVLTTLDGTVNRFNRQLVAFRPTSQQPAGRYELRAGQGEEADRREVRLPGGRLDLGAGSGDLATPPSHLRAFCAVSLRTHG